MMKNGHILHPQRIQPRFMQSVYTGTTPGQHMDHQAMDGKMWKSGVASFMYCLEISNSE